jgi:hypothetical protein
MPGTVSEVSATLVASTMRRPEVPGRNTRSCSSTDSRAYSGRISVPWRMVLAQRLGRLADLALAGQEHQHVAAAGAGTLVDRIDDRRPSASRSSASSSSCDRPVADLDRIGAAGDVDDRRRHAVAPKCLREALGIDRRRGDDQLQVRRRGSSCLR